MSNQNNNSFENAGLMRDISKTYDEFPYLSQAFWHTHPDHLRALSHLFAIPSKDVANARILEIGCSFGGNIIPLAQQYPEARIVGIDISEHQVKMGQQAIASMGLENIRLLCMDVSKLNPKPQQFDYIICHGVYSCVPPDVQQGILRTISKGLAKDGLAIVSYNTYPGWKVKEMMRDVMLFRGDGREDTYDRIAYGMGMLDFMNDFLPENNPWFENFKKQYQEIRYADSHYLAHEFFELVNHPCYFIDFMKNAQQHQLDFVCDSEFHESLVSPLPVAPTEMLERECGDDRIKMYQFYDFLSNRSFRQTVLTHSERIAQLRNVRRDGLTFEQFDSLQIVGRFNLQQNAQNGQRYWVAALNPKPHFMANEITNWLFETLNAANGSSLSIKQLREQAFLKFSEQMNEITRKFYQIIYELILHRGVWLRTLNLNLHHPKNISLPKLTPQLLALCKFISENPGTYSITTPWHVPLIIDDAQLFVARHMDGSNNLQALAQKLLVEITTNKSIVFEDEHGKVIENSEVLYKLCIERAKTAINIFYDEGMLID